MYQFSNFYGATVETLVLGEYFIPFLLGIRLLNQAVLYVFYGTLVMLYMYMIWTIMDAFLATELAK